MMKTRSMGLLSILALVAFAIAPMVAESGVGGRSSSGGSRSYSSGSRSSGSSSWGTRSSSTPTRTASPTRSSGWGTGSSSVSKPVAPAPATKSTWGTKSATTAPPTQSSGWGTKGATGTAGVISGKAPSAKPVSAVDQLAARNAKMNGTTYKSRDEAISAYKTQNASRLTTSFKDEPKIRPAYVPQKTYVGGRETVIVFDRSHGGYGYYDAMGRWMLYDAIHDAANAAYFASMVDRSPEYVVVNQTPGAQVQVAHRGHPFIKFCFWVIALAFVGILLTALLRRR